MVSRWCKIKNNIINKRYSLYSLGIGTIFFCVLYFITKKFGISLCVIKNVLGISCFGCGLTRGFICILELNFKQAIVYNVLSIPLFIAIFLYTFFTVIDIIFNKEIVGKIEAFLSKKHMFIAYVVILLLTTILNKFT